MKSPNFWQNYFFRESCNIEPSENDVSTHDSKCTRNYMQPNFMWFQKVDNTQMEFWTFNIFSRLTFFNLKTLSSVQFAEKIRKTVKSLLCYLLF